MKFQEKVFRAVQKISRGKVLTYKEVAKLTGRPRAWRAVGNILHQNRNSRVPCHRVIKTDGQIGGYRGGIKKKIVLLKKEGLKIQNKRILK